MPNQMRCPKCDYRFSIWEFGAIRTCPKCGVTVQVLGWRGMAAVNVAMFIVFGFLMAGAATQGGPAGWAFFVGVLIVWAWAEAAAMRALLRVTAVAESSKA